MASGRVGGSRSKVSGKIGNEVYQIRKNADGTYSQIISAKGEPTFVVTPRLQVQRMCTSIVESLMRDLKKVACISMQSASNKSKSLNAFASFNLRRVADDCKANWYDNNQFIYPRHLDWTPELHDLGGPFLISSGTLQFNVFDELLYDEQPFRHYFDVPTIEHQLYGMKFNVELGVETVGDFLRKHNMTRLDKIVFCGFRDFLMYNEATEEKEEQMRHCYIIAKINPAVSDSTIISPSMLGDLFLVDADHDCVTLASKDSKSFCIGYLADLYNLEENYYYDAAFTISELEGRQKISSSSYKDPTGASLPWFRNQAPCNVFGSWMGEPTVDPYPSPFV